MDRPKSLFRGRQHADGGFVLGTPRGSRAAQASPRPAPPAPCPDLSRYAALVPHRDGIDDPCHRQLKKLAALGVPVLEMAGCSAIDYGRSQMLSQALMDLREAVLFIDSDMLFNPEDALRLLLRPEPIVCGIYAQKRYGILNCETMPETTEIGFGDRGGDLEILRVGAGFLRIRCDAAVKILEHHGLPLCGCGERGSLWPFFLPMVVEEEGGGHRYLGEDYSFCERARQAGIPIIADTRIPLFHLGSYPYGWDDAARAKAPPRSTGVVIPVFREPEGGISPRAEAKSPET